MSSHGPEPTETDKRVVELNEVLYERAMRIGELENEASDLRQSLAECEEPA